VAEPALSFQELLQLVEVIRSTSQFAEVRLRSGDLELELRRGDAVARATPRNGGEATAIVPAAPSVALPAHQRHGHVGGGEVLAEPTASATAAPAPSVAPKATGAVPAGAQIVSPMVGTFYRAPEPGAAPFVEVGSRVEPDTIVCIIEVMKLMTSMPAGCRGTVRAILVDDGEAIDHGQALIVIEPTAA